MTVPLSRLRRERKGEREARGTLHTYNFLALVRGMLCRTAASLPLAWWDPIAFWTDPGILMIRDEMPATLLLSAQNAVCPMPLTADGNPRGATWARTPGW